MAAKKKAPAAKAPNAMREREIERIRFERMLYRSWGRELKLQDDLAAAKAALKAEVDAHGNTLRLLAAANAELQRLRHETNEQQVALAAATARIVELEALNKKGDKELQSTLQRCMQLEPLVAHLERRIKDWEVATECGSPVMVSGHIRFLKDSLDAANARIAELERANDVAVEVARRIDAEERLAHALVAQSLTLRERDGAERIARYAEQVAHSAETERDAANARADAAERETREADKSNEGLVEQIATVQIEATELRTERDQLAQKLDAAERELKATRDDKQVWINRWYERGGKLLELGDERDQLAQKLDAAERQVSQLLSDLHAAAARTDAANDLRDQLAARVTELEAECDRHQEFWRRSVEAAKERAGAAERYHDETHQKLLEEIEACQKAEAERDQLAARVTEATGYLSAPGPLRDRADEAIKALAGQPQGLRLCTREERQELDALDAIPESELNYSGNWFGWAKPIGDAVRANRAAKANNLTKG